LPKRGNYLPLWKRGIEGDLKIEVFHSSLKGYEKMKNTPLADVPLLSRCHVFPELL
jgi:hypothetical protein